MRLETSILLVKVAFTLTIVLALANLSQGAPARLKHIQRAKTTEAFIWAAVDGNLRKMQFLLSQGTNSATEEDGEKALVAATNFGQIRSINFLLDHGVSAKKENGNEALFLAVEEEETGIVKALLRHGANVNARRSDGATPLMIACFYDTGEDGVVSQSSESLKLLLLHKADVKAKDNYGKTALMYLKNMPNAKIHKMLLNAGARQ